MEAIELRNLYGWLVRLRVLLGRMAHPALDGGGNGICSSHKEVVS